eukprot:12715908-Alexandrium_andersonii.AAC.1
MSASLVGSEMCIRDSSSSASASAESSATGEFAISVRSGASESLPSFFSSCLLYTSDAADDM